MLDLVRRFMNLYTTEARDIAIKLNVILSDDEDLGSDFDIRMNWFTRIAKKDSINELERMMSEIEQKRAK